MTSVEEKKLAAEEKPQDMFHIRGVRMRVYVVGGGFPYIRMFSDMGAVGARDVEDADLICFTGGEDVSPELYGEQIHPKAHTSSERDDFESVIFWTAVELDKPMVGICRGGQFLNVMNQGRMWQHVNNHGGNHPILDMATGNHIEGMTSTHHQMMIPGPEANVLAVAGLSTQKERVVAGVVVKETSDPAGNTDVEAIFYNKTKSLCFQPHPEFYVGACRDYFAGLLRAHIIPLL